MCEITAMMRKQKTQKYSVRKKNLTLLISVDVLAAQGSTELKRENYKELKSSYCDSFF